MGACVLGWKEKPSTWDHMFPLQTILCGAFQSTFPVTMVKLHCIQWNLTVLIQLMTAPKVYLDVFRETGGQSTVCGCNSYNLHE